VLSDEARREDLPNVAFEGLPRRFPMSSIYCFLGLHISLLDTETVTGARWAPASGYAKGVVPHLPFAKRCLYDGETAIRDYENQAGAELLASGTPGAPWRVIGSIDKGSWVLQS
jgi:hypothetical protein